MRPFATVWSLCLLAWLLAGCGNGAGAGRATAVEAPDDAGLDGGFADAFGSLIGPTVEANVAPPPISGGTLLVSRDGTLAIVSDPERDTIDLVSLQSRTLLSALPLQTGDEPGRAVEDNDRRVHVALRGGHSVAVIDLATQSLAGRTAVCPMPRGIAYNPANDSVVVACAGGELVTLQASGGAPTQTAYLDQDLRDVLVIHGTVYVTRFREANVLAVAADGTVSRILSPAVQPQFGVDEEPASAEPTVAWRAIPTADGRIAILHQYAQLGVVQEIAGSYSAPSMGLGPFAGPCSGPIVQTAVTILDPAATTTTQGSSLTQVALGVDLAISPDGVRFAVASAGNLPVRGPGVDQAIMESDFATLAASRSSQPQCLLGHFYNTSAGQVVAVAYTPAGEVLAQTREPAGLYWTHSGISLQLAADSRADTGHTVFHANAGGGLACANCHPEGMDDGHVWTFDPTGPRRTQSLRGSLLSRTPFHWDGDLTGMPALVTEVFDVRMSGGPLAADQVQALGHWLNALPALTAPALPPAQQALVARGRQLFDEPAVGCSGCHSGPLFTNNALVNVGTGGIFKVPSLLAVSWRAPYLHNGCAPALLDRFTDPACGGGDLHGHTSTLPSSDLDALVAYLDTL